MIKRNERQTKRPQGNTCHWNSKHQDPHPSHRPFLIRKCIVLSGIALSIVGCVAEWYSLRGTTLMGPPMNGIPFLQLAFYFCWVTFADFVSHFVLRLKASSFSDKEALLKIEKVKSQELDAYFDTRRNIRLASLIAASCTFGVSVKIGLFAPLAAFCIAYIASTILGILAVRCFPRSQRPRLIHRNKRYDYPPPWIQPFPKTEPELMEPTYYRHLRGEIGTLWY